MKDLIFIGGAKGVGKSTVIDRVRQMVNISVVNTGEIYRNATERRINPEEEIVDYLINHHLGLIDTHYTGGYSKTPNGGHFPRGLSKDNLMRIHSVKSIDFILLDLDERDLIQRRISSKEEKYHDAWVMRKEMEMNRCYFEEYCEDLLIDGLIIRNVDITQTTSLIVGRIR